MLPLETYNCTSIEMNYTTVEPITVTSWSEVSTMQLEIEEERYGLTYRIVITFAIKNNVLTFWP